MTTPFSSHLMSPWSRFQFAGWLWGSLTLAIALLGGLPPALSVEVPTSAVPAKPALKRPIALTPWMPTGVTEADEPVVAETTVEARDLQVESAANVDELVDAEISVQASDLRLEPAARADSSQGSFTVEPVASVADAAAIAQTDSEPTAAAPSTEDLARQSQNPIANLISVPFQNNTNFGMGLYDRTGNILNIQPVIPTNISDDWILINRTIIPVAYQPELAPGVDSAFGLGDIFYQGFFSPKNSGSFTWGIGPAIMVPTATDEVLGTGQWSIGPAAVGLVTSGPIVAGALVNNVWSIAGDSDRPDVSLLTLQPFFNYNFSGGWYVNTSPIITANWMAEGEQWTIPIGGGFGRVFNIDRQPVNMSIGVYWNAVHPEGAADWTLRTQLTLLFPK